MEKLTLEKFKKNQLECLTNFVGGNISTKWVSTDGTNSGSDSWNDVDCDGFINCGDILTLDTGRSVTLC